MSFVVPCYNYGRFVGQAVASLLAQSFESLEVIAIDDCSTDDSSTVLAQFADDSRVVVIRHPRNIGHIATYNEGLRLARGEFVGLMAADDLCLSNNAVERQVEVFERDSRVGFVYSAYSQIDENGTVFWTRTPWPDDAIRDGRQEFAQLISENYVPASGTLVRRACHAEVGYYDPTLPHAADWDLWLRLATRFHVGYIADPLYGYRMHGHNMSTTTMAPPQANSDVLRVLTRAFDALPPEAPRALRLRRAPELRRAALRSVRYDRAAGRMDRAWRGLADAIRRMPSLLLTSEFHSVLVSLSLTSLVGPTAYTRFARWRTGGWNRVASFTGT